MSHAMESTPDDDVPEEDTTAIRHPGLQPESQGDEPLETALGDLGQGDVDDADAQQHSGDAPADLRTSIPRAERRDGGA